MITSSRVSVTSLHHIALPVPDVDRSTNWYVTVFEASVIRRTDVDERDLRAGRSRQAWLQVGEIVVNLAEGRPVVRGEDQHFFHYALGTTDDPDGRALDGWLAHLASVGVETVGLFGHGGLPFLSLYLDDPDGYRWELVIDYPSYDAARADALAHGGRLGNPVASYDWEG